MFEMDATNKVRAFDPWSFATDSSAREMILPMYWHPESPGLNGDMCTIDCSKLPGGGDLRPMFVGNEINEDHPLAVELRALHDERWAKFGVSIIRNTRLQNPLNEKHADAAKLEKLSNFLLREGTEPYTAGSNFRGSVAEETNVYDTGAPRHAHLHYHHEMQYVNRSPRHITFMAMAVPWAKETGPTYVSYNPGATRDILDLNVGRQLADKGACYVRKLPDLAHFQSSGYDPRIVYNFWQTSMDTEDPEEAAAIARSQGLEVEWEISPIFGRYMHTRFYIDAFEYDDVMDKNQLFCSIADDWMWFDTWGGLEDLAPEHRPLALEYGNDVALSPQDKRELAQVYDNHGFPVTWDAPGDIAMICNKRTAHGRPAYEIAAAFGEERELGVLLGQRFQRIGQQEGKW